MSNKLVLRALTGDLRGQEFAVTSPSNWIIGRSRSCSLRLAGDATVSRQHCLIEMGPRGVWVQDLGSRNGTLLNGTKISSRKDQPEQDATYVQTARQELNDGDELRICNNVFAVCLHEGPARDCKDTMRRSESSHQIDLSQGV